MSVLNCRDCDGSSKSHTLADGTPSPDTAIRPSPEIAHLSDHDEWPSSVVAGRNLRGAMLHGCRFCYGMHRFVAVVAWVWHGATASGGVAGRGVCLAVKRDGLDECYRPKRSNTRWRTVDGHLSGRNLTDRNYW